jgi:inner membrane protease subunit 1
VFVRYVGGIGQTSGVSMVPTMPHGFSKRTCIMYSSLHRRGRGIKVGDVITYTHPIFPERAGCKRVIGMPGDFVSVVTPGRVNEEDLKAEDTENKWASIREQVIQVPEGHCWVAGDNLEWSRDSRLYGPLPLGLVTSKVLAVVLPMADAKWLGAEHTIKMHKGQNMNG